MATLEKAILIAAKAHIGQKDKSGEPYILHPLTVMSGFAKESERIVAILHDVIEDTNVTLDDLRKEGFSEEVLTALECITKIKGENYLDYLARVKNNEIALKVKREDIKHNMDFERLNKVDPETADKLIKKYKIAMTELEDK